ncbi:hypothetical protein [Terrabacter sp. Ter38]|uniref:hypothetical protein n=1 Tax=Terrabacter sp. Ter38 TaxID=2926030 RepID=UPI0021185917|nr:hypothetical protein [Terrabacter sp. Ter38]
MQFIAWAIACLILSVALVRRPMVPLITAMSIWVLVPGTAGHVLTGVATGPLAIHPAAVLIMTSAAVQVVERPRRVLAALQHRPEWTVLLATVAGISSVIGIYSGLGFDSIAAAGDQVLWPLVLFFLLGACLLERPERLQTLRTWFVVAATGEALLAIAQLGLQSSIFFTSEFAEQRFFRQDLNRWMGTLDHPLILSFFLVLSLFLLASYRRWWVILPLMLTMLGGIVVTQSRVGVGVAIVGVIYVIRRAALRGAWQRVLLLLPLVAGAAIAVANGVTDAIQARVVDDTGSTSARANALGYFLDHIGEYSWMGQGLNGSFAVSDNAGLGTSFESAVLMYSIDLGIVATAFYFGVMLMTVIRAFGRMVMAGPVGSGVAALLIPQSFSALSGNTAAPMIVWAIFAMTGFGVLLERGPQRHSVPLRRSAHEDTFSSGTVRTR